MRFFIFISFVFTSCTPSVTPSGKPSFASSEPIPETSDITLGCQSTEASGLASLLSLLPPWDPERPSLMLEIASTLEQEECFEAARLLYGEIVSTYQKNKEVPRALLGFGLLSLPLTSKKQQEFDWLLKKYQHPESLLINAAILAPKELGVKFLQEFAKEKTLELIKIYEQWLLRSSAP